MKTSYALATCSILAAVVIGAPLGCSSSETSTPLPPTDSGTEVAADTKPVDTGTDTKKEVAPPPDAGVCDQDLPSDFACTKPKKVAGSTNCSEASLEAYVKACWKPLGGDTTKCTAWKGANAACDTCVKAWTYTSGLPARDYCYYQIMTPECADAVFCYFDCVTQVCTDCSFDPVGSTSDNLECQKRARVAGGRCYENSYKKADSLKCFDSTVLDPCIVDEAPKTAPDATLLEAQLLQFYRGACRDNANWSSSTSAGDAGVDSSTTDTADAD